MNWKESNHMTDTPTSTMTLSERVSGLANLAHKLTGMSELYEALITLAHELDLHEYVATTETTTEYTATLEAPSDWLALPSGAFVNMARIISVDWYEHHDDYGLTLDEARAQGKTNPGCTLLYGVGNNDTFAGGMGINYTGLDADAIRSWLRSQAGTR